MNNLDANSSVAITMQIGEGFPQMNEDYGGFPEENKLKIPVKKPEQKKKNSGARTAADIQTLEMLKSLFTNLSKAEKLSDVMVEILTSL